MLKLIETLKELGIDIPEEKKQEVKTALSKNYKNIAEHEKAVGKIESDRDNWKSRAEAAEETLKSFDGIDPKEVQTQLAAANQRLKDVESEYQQKIYDRDFSDALKSELESVKFSSEAAKRSVMADIKEAGLKLKDGKILGLNDLITQMKEKDASAFIDEEQEEANQQAARFTVPVGKQQTKGGMTKDEIMNIKDATERQNAIAENAHLFAH